jgi:hypothetical protein
MAGPGTPPFSSDLNYGAGGVKVQHKSNGKNDLLQAFDTELRQSAVNAALAHDRSGP